MIKVIGDWFIQRNAEDCMISASKFTISQSEALSTVLIY